MTVEGLDETRLEWEFERLRDKHRDCCVGAYLALPGPRSDFTGPMWINVLAPVWNAAGDGFDSNFRRWDDPWEPSSPSATLNPGR